MTKILMVPVKGMYKKKLFTEDQGARSNWKLIGSHSRKAWHPQVYLFGGLVSGAERAVRAGM